MKIVNGVVLVHAHVGAWCCRLRATAGRTHRAHRGPRGWLAGAVGVALSEQPQAREGRGGGDRGGAGCRGVLEGEVHGLLRVGDESGGGGVWG
eukprot:998887-Prymnesium_polylepis.1